MVFATRSLYFSTQHIVRSILISQSFFKIILIQINKDYFFKSFKKVASPNAPFQSASKPAIEVSVVV